MEFIRKLPIPKEIKAQSLMDVTNGDKNLSYIVIYIGTTGDTAKASGMSISDIKIMNPNKDSNYTPTTNWKDFNANDNIKIDCSIPAVYVNDVEMPYIVDVGSDFFALEPGENTFKVATDDPSPAISIAFNEKYL